MSFLNKIQQQNSADFAIYINAWQNSTKNESGEK